MTQPVDNFSRMEGAWDQLCPFQILSIRDDFDGLNIIVEDNQSGVKKGKFFIDKYHGYRNFNEADLVKYWHKIGGVKHTGLYVSADSSLMRWAADQCIDEMLAPQVKHYMIVSVDDVFEVLCFDEPKFSFENK